MPDQPSPEVELLRAAYAAFNARDFDAAFATMAPDVAWPRAFKGGVVRGHQKSALTGRSSGPRSTRTSSRFPSIPRVPGESWSMCIKSCRDLDGAILGDEHVGHRFTIENGLIQAMEVCPLPFGRVPRSKVQSPRSEIRCSPTRLWTLDPGDFGPTPGRDEATGGFLGPKLRLRVSGNSKDIGEPPNSSVVVSAAMVVAHKQLIHKDGREDLGLVIDESAMPGTHVQFEE